VSSDTPTTEQLEAGLAGVLASPRDNGTLVHIVRRPKTGAREVLDRAALDVEGGLEGDNWHARGSSRTADGSAHPDMQITLMNARMAALLSPRERWALAGDQLYLDFDLSLDNLPAGTRLAVGGAVIEITALPHTGCKKFEARFGIDALRFINDPTRRSLRLRGCNAKVVRPGPIRCGDGVRKVSIAR
jgi:hypothetical protein